MSLIQTVALVFGLSGMAVGMLTTMAGLHFLAHRGEYRPPAPPKAAGFKPSQPVRGKW